MMKRKVKDKGFTLIELLVALGIITMVSAATAPSFIQFMKYNTSSSVKMSALGAAQQVLDELRVEDPGMMPSSGSDSPVTIGVGSRNFSVVITYCSDATYCTTTSRYIEVEVSYNGDVVYDTDTVFTQLK